MVRRRLLISGRVQGVFFRESARRRAEELGLSGWVRNLPDGRVEAVFEGDEKRIEEAVAWCRRGPPAAEVMSVEAHEEPAEGLRGFRVRTG